MNTSAEGNSAWICELQRYLSIKTLFCITGNIYDQLPYTSGDGEMGHVALREILSDFLVCRGYRIVGSYDIVDGLTFADDEQKPLFLKLAGESGTKLHNDSKRGSPSANDVLDSIRSVLSKDDGPSAFVLNYASLLVSRPDELTEDERTLFLKIAKAASGSQCVNRLLNNLLIVVTEKLNDIPPWLYLNNPMCKVLTIERPEEEERRRFFVKHYSALFQASEEGQERDKHIASLSESTQGMMTRELDSLLQLSRIEKIPATQSRELIDRFKFGVRESPWDKLLNSEERRREIQNAERILSESVKGQSFAIRAVVDILKRASQGLSGIQHSARGQRPKGVLFFAGPTGVGKTELAKALARLLFGDEAACIRFDMSEFSQAHSDQRLFGAPPGYVGYEEGGELTKRVKQTPFSILLFDEIEKAHPSILDKFLQILDDGRMTSGQGETVYFSECLLIFTSNKGIYREEPIGGGAGFRRVPIIRPHRSRCSNCSLTFFSDSQDPRCPNPECSQSMLTQEETPYEFIRTEVLRALEQYFKLELGRPEIFNRLGNNFIVFDYVRPNTGAEILRKMLRSLENDLRVRRGIQIDLSPVEPALIERASADLELGGRGIGNLLETSLINPLARRLFEERVQSGANLVVTSLQQVRSNSDLYWEIEWQWR